MNCVLTVEQRDYRPRLLSQYTVGLEMLKGASWNFIARFFIPWNFKYVSSKTHENISKWQSSHQGETKHNRAFLKKECSKNSDEDDDDNSSNNYDHGDDHDEELHDEWLELFYDYETFS